MSELIEWRDGVVRATRDLTPAIRLIEIEPSGAFVAASPGSHINISVLIRARPDVRSYSVVGPCGDGVYRIAVKLLKNTRGGSAYMWSLGPGARIVLSPPSNNFNLALGRPEYLLLAGGIGITPIFAQALALAHTMARFRVLYAVRGSQILLWQTGARSFSRREQWGTARVTARESESKKKGVGVVGGVGWYAHEAVFASY